MVADVFIHYFVLTDNNGQGFSDLQTSKRTTLYQTNYAILHLLAFVPRCFQVPLLHLFVYLEVVQEVHIYLQEYLDQG